MKGIQINHLFTLDELKSHEENITKIKLSDKSFTKEESVEENSDNESNDTVSDDESKEESS